MLTIDGSEGEGGGQILRTSLALSLVTGTPFRLEKIRAGRSKPGLLRQHLAATRAAEAIGAEVEGASMGAQEIVVRPGPVRGGELRFSVGSAGSACLVLQTVLPALLASGEAAEITVEGGTHNPYAPPFDFLARVFSPVLQRMGAELTFDLVRPGFYPAGGGTLRAKVGGGAKLRGLELCERGALRARRARALVAHLPGAIAKRELAVVQEELGFADDEVAIEQVLDSAGPGNVLLLELECEHASELCAGFGELGVRAEKVAKRAIGELRRYLASDAPVGRRLADQLMIPFALAGGVFRTLPLSDHSRTNLEIIRTFLPVEVEVHENERDATVSFSRV